MKFFRDGDRWFCEKERYNFREFRHVLHYHTSYDKICEIFLKKSKIINRGDYKYLGNRGKKYIYAINNCLKTDYIIVIR